MSAELAAGSRVAVLRDRCSDCGAPVVLRLDAGEVVRLEPDPLAAAVGSLVTVWRLHRCRRRP